MYVKIHENYIKRCIEIAKNGLGTTRPNPMVGCVVLSSTNQLLSWGFHEKYGELHAERNAFKNIMASHKDLNVFVSLEPCNHFGQTPPCTDLLLDHSIRQIFYGGDDPNPQVAGRGLERLRQRGVKIHRFDNNLWDQQVELNAIFLQWTRSTM